MKKRVLLLFATVAMALSLTSCEAITQIFDPATKQGKEEAKEILDIIAGNDDTGKNQLKIELCEALLDKSTTDDKVEQIMQLFEGSVNSYEIEVTDHAREKTDGEVTLSYYEATISNINTSVGNGAYRIVYKKNITYTADKTAEGIYYISVFHDSTTKEVGQQNLSDLIDTTANDTTTTTTESKK